MGVSGLVVRGDLPRYFAGLVTILRNALDNVAFLPIVAHAVSESHHNKIERAGLSFSVSYCSILQANRTFCPLALPSYLARFLLYGTKLTH
jgi:hypothetical protein